MERYFILDNYNTFYDWRLILTSKDLTPPEPKTNYVTIDGRSGSLDLSEALTGEVTYHDRIITASFWTDYGTRLERDILLKNISQVLHGRKIKIIDPDDKDHYLLGRVTISAVVNNLSYASFTITAVCEPWRYAIEDITRKIEVKGRGVVKVVIRNNGIKTITPTLKVDRSIVLSYDGERGVELSPGEYTLPTLRLRHGVNIVEVSGDGPVTFTYKEADL